MEGQLSRMRRKSIQHHLARRPGNDRRETRYSGIETPLAAFDAGAMRFHRHPSRDRLIKHFPEGEQRESEKSVTAIHFRRHRRGRFRRQ